MLCLYLEYEIPNIFHVLTVYGEVEIICVEYKLLQFIIRLEINLFTTGNKLASWLPNIGFDGNHQIRAHDANQSPVVVTLHFASDEFT